MLRARRRRAVRRRVHAFEKERLTSGFGFLCCGASWLIVGEMDLMLLTGAYERSLDENCVWRPRPPRAAGRVNTTGADARDRRFRCRCFRVARLPLWPKIGGPFATGHEVRAFSRLLYAQSHSVELDSQGRIRLPAEAGRLANLSGEVVLLGWATEWNCGTSRGGRSTWRSCKPRYDQLAGAPSAKDLRRWRTAGRRPTRLAPLQPR